MDRTRNKVGWIMAASLSVLSLSCYADVTVVGNKAIKADSLTARQVSKLWLAKSKFIPGGGKPAVVEQALATAVYDEFYKTVITYNDTSQTGGTSAFALGWAGFLCSTIH